MDLPLQTVIENSYMKIIFILNEKNICHLTEVI